MNMQEVAQSFTEQSIPEPNTGCLLWLGSVDRKGYGTMVVDGRNVRATHVALALRGVVVPRGKQACHHCDTPGCVSEDHLYAGTPKQNTGDAIRRGRQKTRGIPWPVIVERERRVSELVSGGARNADIERTLGLHSGGAAYLARKAGRVSVTQEDRTHCPRGHELTAENIRWVRNARSCKACHREREHARYHGLPYPAKWTPHQ